MLRKPQIIEKKAAKTADRTTISLIE